MISTLSRLAFVLCFSVAIGSGQTVTLSSNFGPNESFNPSIGWGSVYPSGLAYPFTVPESNYAFQSASLALSLGIGTQNSVTIVLAQDGGGVPAAALETFVVNGVLQPYPNDTTPVTVTSVAHPLLKGNTVYWIVAYPTYSGNGVNWLTAQILTNPDLQAIRSTSGTWSASPLLYGTNNPGAFSVTATSIAPTLNYPANDASNIGLTPALTWNPSPQATSYDVYIGTSFPPSFVGNTSGTSFTTSTLLPNQVYIWQVVAHSPVGSTPSSTGTFFTGTPLPAVTATGVSPGTGNWYNQIFGFTFSDTAGTSDLSVLDVLVNNYLDGVQACYFAFVPSGASSGYLYLVDDAGDGGYVSGSPMSLPSSGVLQNSQCSINVGTSSVSSSGNTLTLNVAVNFASGFGGNKIFYTAVRSATQNSGWQALATWSVPVTYPPSGPYVGGVSPARGTTTSSTYAFTFSDINGYQDLHVVDVLINNFLDGISACYFAYVPTSATDGYVYLVDDAGDGGYVSGTPMLLSSGGSLQNSQCIISTTGASASASGQSIVLNLPISFNPSFAGNRVFYLAARESGIGNSGWQSVGSVTVP